MIIAQLRSSFHARVCQEIIRVQGTRQSGHPNMADSGNKSSRAIAWGILQQLQCEPDGPAITGQRAGVLFERLTKEYIEKAFTLLHHLRPGKWRYSVNSDITN